MRGVEAIKRWGLRVLGREPWWAEFWSAGTALMWAAMSQASSEGLRDWPSMRVLTEIGDDRFWHVCGFGLGLAQFAFLMADQRWARWTAALMMAWFWGVLTIGVWNALPWAPATAVYAGWCVANVYSILRLLPRQPT